MTWMTQGQAGGVFQNNEKLSLRRTTGTRMSIVNREGKRYAGSDLAGKSHSDGGNSRTKIQHGVTVSTERIHTENVRVF